MKTLMFISRVLTGLVFVFSGFVKAIDPSGFAIKLEEYFMAFHMDFLIFSAMPLAIVMACAELMIGLNLLLKVRMKFTAWLLVIFMIYFTVLTFILALTNPVSDCGCFGDAVKLTNWQTFGKNIILLVPAVFVFLKRKKYTGMSDSLIEWIFCGTNFILPVILSVYCLYHQPVLDFRPYTPGTNIPDKMRVPEGAPTDLYETILVYEKDGLQKEFAESNFPWQDTTWKWVETRQKLIKKGIDPEIHDFSITNSDGADVTETVLSNSNYVFLVIAPKLEKASEKAMKKMNDMAVKAASFDYPTYCLTSSVTSEIERFRNRFQPSFEICTSDETTLKTIVRANPGVLIMSAGTIIGKWNYRDAPKPEDMKKNMLSVILKMQNDRHEILTVVLIIMAMLFIYARAGSIFKINL